MMMIRQCAPSRVAEYMAMATMADPDCIYNAFISLRIALERADSQDALAHLQKIVNHAEFSTDFLRVRTFISRI